MATDNDHDNDALLIDFLRKQNCSSHEIEQVLAKLREHDNRTMRESVFESIESGSFNLKAIIEECKE